jgi:transcriptional regulator with XRE-family HTH domain
MTKKATDRAMKVVGEKITSVSELVRDASDPEFAEAFKKYQAERRLVNCLTVTRCAKGVSQAELAARMGCGQSKVSKMESSTDADLNFGDIASYAFALKQSVFIAFSQDKLNGADRIRSHVECIKRELEELVKLADDDKTDGDGVEAFAIETVKEMLTVIERSLDKIPHQRQHTVPEIYVEAEGDRGQHALNAPERIRRAHNKRTAVSESFGGR